MPPDILFWLIYVFKNLLYLTQKVRLMQNKVLLVFLCRSLELALGKLWSCILMLLKVINTGSDYPAISHLQVDIDLVVQDNDNCQRHNVLDHAGEQSVPDSVLCVKGISIVPILRNNISNTIHY